MFVDVSRRAALLNDAVVHDHDAVGHHHGLALVMGDIDGGDADALLQIADEEAHVVAQAGVEIGERFVEQQHRGFDDQRAGERYALLLAAGQFPRIALFIAGELDHLQHGGDAPRAIHGRDLANLQPEGQIFRHRHVRKQRIGLEHHAEIAMLGHGMGHVAAAEQQPALGHGFEPGDAAQRRRLAAARRPQKRNELALADIEVDISKDMQRPIELVDRVQSERGHVGSGLSGVETGEDRGRRPDPGKRRRQPISRFQRSATSAAILT